MTHELLKITYLTRPIQEIHVERLDKKLFSHIHLSSSGPNSITLEVGDAKTWLRKNEVSALVEALSLLKEQMDDTQ